MTAAARPLGAPARDRAAALAAHAAAGRTLLHAISLAAPAGTSPRAALLLTGDLDASAALALGLADVGWTLLADRPCPTTWLGDTLLASPDDAPLVTSAHVARGRACRPVRPASTAVTLDLPRAHTPTPVSGIVQLAERRPEEDAVAALGGHDRLALAARLVVGGALTASPADRLPADFAREHLALAAIRTLSIRVDPGSSSSDLVDDALTWWNAS